MVRLLENSKSTLRIVFITSGMGPIMNTVGPNGAYDSLAHLVPYEASKATEPFRCGVCCKVQGEGAEGNCCCGGLRLTNYNKELRMGGFE